MLSSGPMMTQVSNMNAVKIPQYEIHKREEGRGERGAEAGQKKRRNARTPLLGTVRQGRRYMCVYI